MTRVVLDLELRKKLGDVQEHLEVCDESGRTLGHLLPEEVYQRMMLDWGNSQISNEELKRRSELPGGKSLAEVWAELGRRQ